ncbi:hypothetical protein BC792_11060 [Sphingobacterium allocomposti]|uniref:Uncharacterized protein n=2 Tax=Sphingobacterium allocomposti TaxID=415956 RepID=A0A5S5DLP5_9SPHI|nr:hypothetical protein BC792_11060 [Sphingobacterium composti Yoo et al. 2007 non Ten et al. 2007]
MLSLVGAIKRPHRKYPVNLLPASLSSSMSAARRHKIRFINIIKIKVMNVKRTFGTILTILGIIGLIYTGYELINNSTAYTPLIVIGVISLIFFFSGIGLVKNTKDAA